MIDRGCTPIEIDSLLKFRDHDLVVRCLELVRSHIEDFAPRCCSWDVRIIALGHHNPDNVYPALGVYEANDADFEDIERFGQGADEWVRKQPFGWLLDASIKVDAPAWDILREERLP